MLKIPREKPVLILIIATSFGEADWILPVVTCLKENYTEWEIVTVFGSDLAYHNVVTSSLSFYFSKISSINIVPTQIPQLFQEMIDANQVKIILKDYNKDEWAPFKSQLASRCPRALLVSFPHSTYFYSNKETDPIKRSVKPDDWSLHDIFLLSSENDIPYWSEFVATERIRICGYPRYDSWWMDKLLKTDLLQHTKEAIAANNSANVFFCVSRGDHPHYLDRSDYEYLVKSICEQVFSIPGSLLLIKPHPRQDVNDLQNLLRNYDPSRYIISYLHLMQLASLSHIIISLWSSGILDSLAVNKPVIEFWKFNSNKHHWRKTPEGNKTTIYRELGLAYPANTESDLKEAIASIFSDPKTLLESQTKAFNSYCKNESNASLKTVNYLLEGVEQKRLNYKKKITTQAFKTIIEEQLIFGENLIEQNTPEKAVQYFDIMRNWYPDDPRVGNNAGVARYLVGDINKAMEIFQTTLNCHPNHIDTVINLMDLLFAQKLQDKALEVILNFISSEQTTQTKKEIHQMVATRPFSENQLKQIELAMSKL